jgi:cell division protein FtsX
MGLLGLGIFLGIVGAVFRFAVTTNTPYVDLKKAGMILLYSGILIAVLGLILGILDGSIAQDRD